MAQELEGILDRCLEAARRGDDPEAILRQHGEVADEVRPLLALAAELGDLPSPQPPPHALEKVFAHLALEQAGAGAAARPRRRFFLRPSVVAAAAALFLLLAGWSVLNVSAGAVPGDWLYPLKRLAERTKHSLTLRPEKRAELHIARSDERLKEAVIQQRRGKGIDPELLRAMLDETVQALETASTLAPASREVLLRRVACSCEFQCQMLAALKEGSSREELEALKPFMAACDARCTCMENATGGGACTATSVAEVAGRMRELMPPVPAPR